MVGDPRDSDAKILQRARSHGELIFTHDLDFAALLAGTRGTGPSVLQVRTHDVLPETIGELVLAVLREHTVALEQGALVSVDRVSARVRILPLK